MGRQGGGGGLVNRNRPTAVLAALDIEAATLASNLPRSDATSPNLPIWEGALESEPVVLVVAERLRIAALKVVERAQIVVSGVVLTGDQIVTSRDVRDRLLRDFPDGACFDMETAAVAQVAHQNQVPWGALRITSDSADETFNLHEVLGFGADSAAELFDRVIVRFLRG